MSWARRKNVSIPTQVSKEVRHAIYI